jgi:CRP-like cAMP-binding protein
MMTNGKPIRASLAGEQRGTPPAAAVVGGVAQSDNLLLAAVDPIEFEQLRELLEPFSLRMRETLQEAGDPTEYVYFPTSGIISLLTVLENGMMIEFATVGREGMTGTPIILGLEESNLALVSQLPGTAVRMKTPALLDAIGRLPAFAAVLRIYGGVMFAFLAQSAACNRAHTVDERLARWLLMIHDQVGGNDFRITQEFLSHMLGVSRPSVAASAAVLHRAGLIRYNRGDMTVTDRPGLEAAACECYAVIRTQFDRLRALTAY